TPDISVMKPMRMTSSLMPWAETLPASMPVARIALLRTVVRRLRARMIGFPFKGLHAQKRVEFGFSGFELGGCDVMHGTAVLHDIKPVCQRGGKVKVLLDHDDGVALCFQHQHHSGERLHDHRG